MNSLYNDESEEGNALYESLMADVVLWQGSKAVYSKEKGVQPRLGFFSELLANTQVFMYDHPMFEKSFPNGFVTENTIFVSAQLYKDVLASEPQRNRDSTLNTTGFLFENYLLTMVEKKYDVMFDNVERDKVFTHTNVSEYNYSDPMLARDKLKEPIPFLALKDLVELANSQGIVSVEHMKSFGTNSDSISQVLFKSKELHDIKNPLNKIVDKVIESQEVLEIEKMSVKEFAEQYENYYKTGQLKIVFEALHNLGEKVLSKPSEEIVAEAKKQLIPFIMELNDTNFEYGLANFKDQLTDKNKAVPFPSFTEIRKELAIEMAKMDNMTVHRRDRMICVITEFSSHESVYRGMKTRG